MNPDESHTLNEAHKWQPDPGSDQETSDEFDRENLTACESVQKITDSVGDHITEFVCKWAKCGERFDSRVRLGEHFCQSHFPEEYKCSCGEKVQNYLLLVEHSRECKVCTVPKQFTWVCDWEGCKMPPFKNKASLRDHGASTHIRFKRFGCDYCGKRFQSNQRKLDHESNFHKRKSTVFPDRQPSASHLWSTETSFTGSVPSSDGLVHLGQSRKRKSSVYLERSSNIAVFQPSAPAPQAHNNAFKDQPRPGQNFPPNDILQQIRSPILSSTIGPSLSSNERSPGLHEAGVSSSTKHKPSVKKLNTGKARTTAAASSWSSLAIQPSFAKPNYPSSPITNIPCFGFLPTQPLVHKTSSTPAPTPRNHHKYPQYVISPPYSAPIRPSHANISPFNEHSLHDTSTLFKIVPSQPITASPKPTPVTYGFPHSIIAPSFQNSMPLPHSHATNKPCHPSKTASGTSGFIPTPSTVTSTERLCSTPLYTSSDENHRHVINRATKITALGKAQNLTIFFRLTLRKNENGKQDVWDVSEEVANSAEVFYQKAAEFWERLGGNGKREYGFLKAAWDKERYVLPLNDAETWERMMTLARRIRSSENDEVVIRVEYG